MISITDLNGNQVSSYKPHSASVNQISIDDPSAEFVASASDDGLVVVHSLYNIESDVTVNFKRPVKAVALEYGYAKSGDRKVCSGGMAEYLNLSGKGKCSFQRSGFMLSYRMVWFV